MAQVLASTFINASSTYFKYCCECDRLGVEPIDRVSYSNTERHIKAVAIQEAREQCFRIISNSARVPLHLLR